LRLQAPGAENRFGIATQRLIASGGTADQVDGAIIMSRIMDVSGQDGGELAVVGEVDEA